MPLTLLGQQNPLASSDEQLKVLTGAGGCPPFERRLEQAGLFPLHATGITILQINVGKLCNQTCRHCHVDAGPDRTEIMSDEIADLCLAALAKTDIPTIDITGGAPELNRNFRRLVERARALDRHVIDRCNLSVLLLPSQADLAEFLASHRVEIIASLPAYRAGQTDAQRGEGIFEKSIEALTLLNKLGYGRPESGLVLNLVYNPVGAFLPPKQEALEAQFRKELRTRYDIEFNRLYTVTNMPISRFLEFLMESGNYDAYMERLATAFNPAAAAGVMCRSMISVGWDGTAVLLAEFTSDSSLFGRLTRRSLDVLAGVPSIVFGLFGNAFFCKTLGLGFSILSGGLTLACMVLPILIRSTEEGFRAVPDYYRLSAAALGLSRTTTLVHLLLPAAVPGLLVGLVLGIGRAIAETAALIFTSGYVDRMPESLLDSGRALSIHIFDLSMNVSGGDAHAYASALVLVVLLLAINGTASWLAEHRLHRRIVTI